MKAKPPDHCPECGSDEVRATQRRVIPDGLIDAFVCGNCDWASDPRIGRPPADRSKNYTLRRLMENKPAPSRDESSRDPAEPTA
jgi:hypothetical protein